MIYAVEFEYYDTGTATVETYYAATRGFTTTPSDTPANTFMAPRLLNPASLRRDVFDIGTVGGASRVGFGEIVLDNTDGALDAIALQAYNGRTLTVRCVDALPAAYPGSWSTILVGTMDQVEANLSALTIRIRDRQVFTAIPFQPTKFAGTNVLPAGVEGIDTDIKGKPKPKTMGTVWNVSPVMVNTSTLIYQVEDGPIRDVTAVYDSGALLTHGTDYTDQADMEANDPSLNTFRVWKAGGMFRLGSAPFGEITADVVQGDTPFDRTASAIFYNVLVAIGVTPSLIFATDLTALAAANMSTLGLYVRDEANVQQVLDDVARSVGAWWGADAAGNLRIKRLEAPSGSPAITITDFYDNLTKVPLTGSGLPNYRVTVRAAPNYTVQTSGLMAIVSASRRGRLAQPYQDAIEENLTIQVADPLSQELVVETKFACLGAGATEAARLLALYGTRRERYEISIPASQAVIDELDLGIVIQLTTTRYGMSAGKLFRVLGYGIDAMQDMINLTLWG